VSSGNAEQASILTRVAAASGLTGLAVMGLELTAVRLLAPHFGDSAYVWTNVIGAILVALAAGAWFGGRLAERAEGSPLSFMLMLAALWTATVPLATGPLGSWLMPQQVPLDQAMPALEWGSLAATLLLFAAPVFLLGMVGPGLITRAVRAGIPIGRAAGAVSAMGTLGSLLGTFLATHWSVPMLGSRWTVWLCGGLMALAALTLGAQRRPSATAGLVLCLLLPTWTPQISLRPPASPTQLIEECESAYQFLQVVRTDGIGSAPARTELKINEGLDSFHSLALAGRCLTSTSESTPEAYYDYHALLPLLLELEAGAPPISALSIGDAAGTFRRIYAGVHETARMDGVEIDPKAVELGERHFSGERAPGRVLTGVDGRAFLTATAGSWDVIHVDAYSHQVYIPAHLASREFFLTARERLRDGGLLACNVGGIRPDDPVVSAIASTMADVFGWCRALRIPRARNYLLVTGRGNPFDPTTLAERAALPSRLQGADRLVWQAILQHAADPTNWHTWSAGDGGMVLCDDRPLLDVLLRESYVGRAAGYAELTPSTGNLDPAAAEVQAYEAWQSQDHIAVLHAVAESERATPFLRYLAGGAQWSLRRLEAAKAEYQAALSLELEGAQQSYSEAIRRDLASLQIDILAQTLARDAARFSRGLALGLTLVGALLLIAAALRISTPGHAA
jgi:spermidine synthase